MARSPRRTTAMLAVPASILLCLFGSAAPSSADSAPESGTAYHEQYRPQFHFTPAQNWMNDPNGLVYYQGEYHLFYQYNPAGNTWGNMSWGHAVSTDLVHWQQLPLAIPQDDQEMIFSGSAVVDKDNTTGFGTPGNPAMVAIYTSLQKASGKQEQALAYSTDRGRTWTKYAGNPVLDIGSKNFRDPKVFWYEPTHSWLMTVALSDQRKVSFYSSPDLKHWTQLSDFGPAGATAGVWECPDLFPLRVDGDPRHVKWVVVVGTNRGPAGTAVQYFTGDFDGRTFTSDDPPTYTPPTGTVSQDFESGYQGWTSTGTAFGNAPAAGALPGQQTVSGYLGGHLVNSFTGGDASTGTLTSPTFTLDRPYLNFLVGGGDHPHVDGAGDGSAPPGQVFADFQGSTWGPGWTATGAFNNAGPTTENLPGQLGPRVLDTFVNGGDTATGTITSPSFTLDSDYIDLQVGGGNHLWGQSHPTAVNLIVGGTVVASATGQNSSDLNWVSWNTAKYKGQQATIQIVDDNDGASGWGHLAVGDIVFANQPAAPRDAQTAVNLVIDGKVVRSATGNNSEALDWTSWDLRDLAGKQAQIQIVDHNTQGWGHILADQFMLADAPALNADQRAHWVDQGADFYASATYNDVPDGSRIIVGWMNNWNYGSRIPTSPWRSADTIPRELSLRTIDGHAQLVQEPVRQLTELRSAPVEHVHDEGIPAGTTALPAHGSTVDIEADLDPGNAKRFGLNVRTGRSEQTQIGYDTTTQQLYLDRSHSGDVNFSPNFTGVQRAPLPLTSGHLRLHILVDESSVEVFADHGQVVLTDQVFPDPASDGISAFADNGTARIADLSVNTLKSIWD